MQPYYEEPGIQIFHGDCAEVIDSLPMADLLLTDPPYGVGLIAKKNTSHHGKAVAASVHYEDDAHTIERLIRVVIPRLLQQAQRAIIFPGTRMLWKYPEASAVGGVYLSNGAGLSPWGFQCIHPILFYGRDPFQVDGKGCRPNSFRTEQHDDWIDHPCPKPLHWMRWCVARGSRPGELILDSFMGSGTTLRAAKDLGRRAIGIEIEERYCEIAVNRLRQGVLPLGTD
jgi:DNA modification methylase